MHVTPPQSKAVVARGLAKCFRIYDRPSDRLIQALIRRPLHREFWALHGIDLVVSPGEILGILGRNGSGKSTLLQIIAGTLEPSLGTVETRSRVAALLELGAGFNPEFTGRENALLNAHILGLSSEEADGRLDDILAFADIGVYADQPVKTYSSGMFVRLAFSVATCVSPDVLLVDEALAVGDVQFQSKCFRRFEDLVDRGTTILFVTHSTEQVVRHCTRAIALEEGHLVDDGPPAAVANRYLERTLGAQSNRVPSLSFQLKDGSSQQPETDADHAGSSLFELRPGYCRTEHRWGNGGAQIVDFAMFSLNHQHHRTSFPQGTDLEIQMQVTFPMPCHEPIFGLFVKTPDGVTVFGNSTANLDLGYPGEVQAGTRMLIAFSVRLHLCAGTYLLSLGVSSKIDGEVVPLDRRYDAVRLDVLDDSGAVGLAELGLQCRTSILNDLSIGSC